MYLGLDVGAVYDIRRKEYRHRAFIREEVPATAEEFAGVCEPEFCEVTTEKRKTWVTAYVSAEVRNQQIRTIVGIHPYEHS